MEKTLGFPSLARLFFFYDGEALAGGFQRPIEPFPIFE
jgi:hypothetical protein